MTEEDREQFDAREFLTNALWGRVPATVCRLAATYPGFTEHAVLSAVLASWDRLPDGEKVRAMVSAATGGADPSVPADGSTAPVAVGTRIIDLRQGETQAEAVVTEVRPECVFARSLLAGRTFAARYDQFGVVAREPAKLREGGDHHG